MKKNIFKNIKIFADGADYNEMIKLNNSNFIKGLTTNPSLMKKNKVKNYEEFAKKVLKKVKKKPISFEVFSDDLEEMKRQAEKINSWGKNVYVKIPITNTKGQSSLPLIEQLLKRNTNINITAIMTKGQINGVFKKIKKYPNSKIIISIFAGRIADTGNDPIEFLSLAINLRNKYNLKYTEVLWASPRELLNIFQANEIGVNIITITNDILSKLNLVGKSLKTFSLETVIMFKKDAVSSKFSL